MAKGKEVLTVEEVCEAANKLHNLTIQMAIKDGSLNTGNLASIIAAVWRLTFAYVERETGLEAARGGIQLGLELYDGHLDRRCMG